MMNYDDGTGGCYNDKIERHLKFSVKCSALLPTYLFPRYPPLPFLGSLRERSGRRFESNNTMLKASLDREEWKAMIAQVSGHGT